MLFNLLTSLIDQYSFLNVFRYLTFRTGLSVVTSLIVVFIIGGPLIKLFSEKMITGPIRQDGPIDHIIKKSGTPTMGGVIIIIGILSSTFLWADLTNIYIWTLIFVSLSLGTLGLLDDILKIKFNNSTGLKSSHTSAHWRIIRSGRSPVSFCASDSGIRLGSSSSPISLVDIVTRCIVVEKKRVKAERSKCGITYV